MGLHFKFCLVYETEPPTSLDACEGIRLPPSAVKCLPRGAALEWLRTLWGGWGLYLPITYSRSNHDNWFERCLGKKDESVLDNPINSLFKNCATESR